MSIPALLDHVVVAGPDLAALVEWFAERTGVVAAPGGVHPTGTANALVAFTVAGERVPHYLELIGPDPARDVEPTTFGIDAITEPTVVTYAIHPDDIDEVVGTARRNGFDPGDVTDLSRRTPDGALLEWRLTRGSDPRWDVPFLIDWGRTPQPGLGAIPTIELLSFTQVEPESSSARAALAALGLPEGALAAVSHGDASGFSLTVVAADGSTVTL